MEKLGAHEIKRNAQDEIVHVDLRNTQITDAALAHLKGLTSLEWLDLTYTQVADAGVAQLEKALPKCRVFGGGGR